MKFKECLKKNRIKSKLSQKTIAEKLGISTRSYQDYEYGKFEPNIEKLIILADIFNISIDELVGRKFPK